MRMIDQKVLELLREDSIRKLRRRKRIADLKVVAVSILVSFAFFVLVAALAGVLR